MSLINPSIHQPIRIIILTSQPINHVVTFQVKWENYLVSLGRLPVTRTEELKTLVRHGIPHQHRAQVWKDLLYQRIENERDRVGVTYYTDLLKEKEAQMKDLLSQIKEKQDCNLQLQKKLNALEL